MSFSFEWNDEYRQVLSKYTLERYNEIKPPTPQYLSGTKTHNPFFLSQFANLFFYLVPIQVQLVFSTLSGDKILHTVTLQREVTCSQTTAEENVHSTVIALQAVHESARLAQQGTYLFIFYVFKL